MSKRHLQRGRPPIGSVLIIGCGYVGVPLAKVWIARGCEVYGTTRTGSRREVLREAGIRPILLDVRKPALDLPTADRVYFLVPGTEILGKGMARILTALRGHPPKAFIFSSGTGVYGDYEGDWVDEASPRKAVHATGLNLIEAEDRLLNACQTRRFPGVIARLSGIYGPARIPGRGTVESGSPIPGDSEAFLNLIHLEDLVSALVSIALLGKAGGVYLLSDDRPVKRGDYYRFLADRLGLAEIRFAGGSPEGRSGSRRCRNTKMKQQLEVTLKYPSYREGLTALIPWE